MHVSQIRIDPRVITRLNLCIVAILAILDLGVFWVNYHLSFRRPPFMEWLQSFVTMNSETNLPTWYSSMLIAICGVLLWVIAISFWKDSQRTFSVQWVILATAILLVSLDEFTMLHEQAGALMFRYDWVYSIPLVSDRPWVIPVLAGCIIFFSAMVPFLAKLPRATLVGFVIAGLVYVSGAVVVELLTPEIIGRWLTHRQGRVLPVIEESLELTGFILFLRAILAYMAESVSIQITSKNSYDL